MGGSSGGTTVIQPKPAPQPSTADAIKAYIQGLPAMYGAQMEWAPKLAEQDIGMMQQYIPQLAELSNQLQMQYAPEQAAQAWQMQQQYAPLYAQQQQALQQQFEPGAYGALQSLGGMMEPGYLGGQGGMMQAQSPMLEQLGAGMTPDWMYGYRAQEAPGMDLARERIVQGARDAWADRGLLESGMSAFDEARMLSEFEFPYAMQQEALTQQVQAQRQGQAQALGGAQLGTLENAYNRYLSELGRRQNVGLSLAGRYNVPVQQAISTPQIGTPGYTAPNLMQGYDFGQVQNAMAQNYGTYAAASRPLLGQSGTPNWALGLSGVGSIFQGLGSMATGGMFGGTSSRRYKKNIKKWAAH